MDMDTSNSDSESSDSHSSEFLTEDSQTRLQDKSISDKAKKRVLKVDPHNGRCLIENCNPTRGVEFAHCYPRCLTKKFKQMTSLEYWWDMKYQTLNLDTRYNIFPVNANLHRIFDKPNKLPSWTLLPTDEVIMKFWNTLRVGNDGLRYASRGNFPTFSDSIFIYRLIIFPMSKLRGCVIAHQHVVTNDDKPSIHHFQLYAYPFDDYPILESHLRPQFVILEAGRKLKELPFELGFDFVLEHPILRRISDLYEAWTAATPKGALKDEEFNPPPRQESSDDDGDEDDEDETTRGRYNNPRNRARHNDLPTKRVKSPKERKRDGRKGRDQQRDAELEDTDNEMESKRSGNVSFRLSGKTLRDHDANVGKFSMSERILQWFDVKDLQPPELEG